MKINRMIKGMFSKTNSRIVSTTFNVLLKRTDKNRWSKLKNFSDNWDERTKIMAKWIRPNQSIIEFGCGKMRLKDFIPVSCDYTLSDFIKRSKETLLIDLNKKGELILPKKTVYFF